MMFFMVCIHIHFFSTIVHTSALSHSLTLSLSLSLSLSLGAKNRLGVHRKTCLRGLCLAPYFIYVTLDPCLLCFALLCFSRTYSLVSMFSTLLVILIHMALWTRLRLRFHIQKRTIDCIILWIYILR